METVWMELEPSQISVFGVYIYLLINNDLVFIVYPWKIY